MKSHEKLGAALSRAHEATDKYNTNILRSSDISRQDRELLTHGNWLQEIIKGWYMLVRPDLLSGDSTAWYASFWDFLRVYLSEHYGRNYCLSAEASLELQIANTLIPAQVIVIVSKGGTLQKLPFGTSIMSYADAGNIPEQRVELDGLQVMPLPLALCKVTPTFFLNQSESAQIALRSVRMPSELSRVILQNEFKRPAERIIGAYQAIGMEQYAEQIINDLKMAGMKITPNNPFQRSSIELKHVHPRSPHAARMEVLWQKYRNTIIDVFPKPLGLSKDPGLYLSKVDEIYQYDAYNSLSIEGYHVSDELIERVTQNQWNPDANTGDAESRDALAARGYYEAFQCVKKTLERILKGESPGICFSKDLSVWYQNLFAPSVRANLLSLPDIMGYRTDRVYIRNSRHVPPPKEAVLDSMDSLFKCLQEEPHAAVRAVLGHYIFVYIHPYMDGNGRIARFLLNIMLASGGYPWTVVQVKRRQEYITALETTHTENNIELFARFILKEMKLSKKYLSR